MGDARLTGQVLIFDADDTLWENNVVFERVIEDFLDWVDHPVLDRDRIRELLNEIEAANAVVHGYGSKVFLRSLGECLERLRERPATPEEARRIDELALAFTEHRVELMPGVARTLDELGARHQLLLLTKGDTEEQSRKVEASGLAPRFRGVHIVPEKDVDTYRELLARYGFAPEAAWMIGNSPKSDIIPAREAGMSAVFIPNDNTWVLEQSEIDPADERVLRLAAFPELLRHF
ncbi:HAD family hydrolase [Streptomyces sp. NPDC088354]|uniref:HAD family hydrolase n=1 Tax=unclassified Streptomyces TaxID=2593676 RepID=UPI0029B17354|nr:HAD family hydrolase [Streptomyces sp. MI02-7b]MDX3074536.1 HAD family hydrolase [Streptomyces sp. MI02-7b]